MRPRSWIASSKFRNMLINRQQKNKNVPNDKPCVKFANSRKKSQVPEPEKIALLRSFEQLRVSKPQDSSLKI